MVELEFEGFWDAAESALDPTGRPSERMSKMLLDIGENEGKDDAAYKGEAGSLQRLAANLVHNSTFERANGLVILANSIFIALQMNATAENLRGAAAEGYSEGWRYADYCFTVIFVFELVLRMVAERQRFFTGYSRRWNMFDLGMVAMAVLEETLSLVPSSGVIHILRFLRFVRLASFVRFFREERMFWGRVHSIAFLVWAILLLMMVAFLFAHLLTEGVSTALEGNELSELEIAPPPQFFAKRPQYV